MQEYKDIDNLVSRIIEIKLVQFNSVDINLGAETTAVCPMKGRARNGQNTNTIHVNIQ